MRAALEPQRHAPSSTTASDTPPAGAAKTLPKARSCYERMETVENAEATIRPEQTPPVCERTS